MRVRALSRKAPSIELVTANEFCFSTHLCMSMRGVEKQNSFAVTSSMLGAFRDNARTRMEFLELIKADGARWERVVKEIKIGTDQK